MKKGTFPPKKINSKQNNTQTRFFFRDCFLNTRLSITNQSTAGIGDRETGLFGKSLLEYTPPLSKRPEKQLCFEAKGEGEKMQTTPHSNCLYKKIKCRLSFSVRTIES